MQKVLLFSHNGFSDENANGITMKNLLSAWHPEEKAEFYCGTEAPDFSAAHHYFRVTDMQALKSFLGKKSRHIFSYADEIQSQTEKKNCSAAAAKRIPAWLKKYKYNFFLKTLREYFWILGPWGHRAFWNWIERVSPDVIFYMVGESFFMDRLVMKVCEKTEKPLILYNGEAYRIIDLNNRSGLERVYYRHVEKLYGELSRKASMIVYNCDTLKHDYERMYPGKYRSMIAYNSAACVNEPYKIKDGCKITYFGNLGVGRSAELLRVASVLKKVDPALKVDIYGNAAAEWEEAFREHSNTCYHGFVNAQELRGIIERSDILLHVETFDESHIPKLRYAFSTKIAQCLCSGRCLVSFAPSEMASSKYLQTVNGKCVVSDEAALEGLLRKLISHPDVRQEYAKKAHQAGLKSHQMHITSQQLRDRIGEIIHEISLV